MDIQENSMDEILTEFVDFYSSGEYMYKKTETKRVLTVKELIELIDKYSLENYIVHPCLPLIFCSKDNIIIIHTMVNKDRKDAYYNYPENWKSINRNVLKRSIQYNYMERFGLGLRTEKDLPESVIAWDPTPYSQVEIVPYEIYDIYNSLDKCFDEC